MAQLFAPDRGTAAAAEPAPANTGDAPGTAGMPRALHAKAARVRVDDSKAHSTGHALLIIGGVFLAVTVLAGVAYGIRTKLQDRRNKRFT